MREQIDTIPVNDAFASNDECPFCYLERMAEQSAIRSVAGNSASYMEPDARAETDKTGFCPVHMKKLYDYGNALGNALILQTHYAGLLESFREEMASFTMPAKRSIFGNKAPTAEPYWQKLQKQAGECLICQRMEYHMGRYYTTFFHMIKDPEFRARVENSKGFCLRHFPQLLQQAEEKLPNAQREWFYPTVFRVTEANLTRVKEDLDWFVAKFDYRNASADWKNSRDAVSRAMQKLEGGYVADPPYKKDS
jgi:hypothetical protein